MLDKYDEFQLNFNRVWVPKFSNTYLGPNVLDLKDSDSKTTTQKPNAYA